MTLSKVPKEFPNEAPTMFSKNAVDHPIVNNTTLEINFAKFYPWEKKVSKVVDLIAAADKYFNNNSPFDNSVSRKTESLLRSVDNLALKGFEGMDVNAFYNDLS